MRGWVFVGLVVWLVPSSAGALNQSVHKSLTKTACSKLGLPSDFCSRAAAAAYNVDAYEFDDLAAHGQRANNQTLCEAAAATQARVQTLGSEIRYLAVQMAAHPTVGTAQDIADRLGKVLHTIQDNCVHEGISNPQHAYYSLSDRCDSTTLSPDASVPGLACATTQTKNAFNSFWLLLSQTGLVDDSRAWDMMEDVDSVWTHWPTRGASCAFLDEAYTWDGFDVRWNNELMVPQLDNQLAYSLTTDDDSLGSICADIPEVLNATVEYPWVNVFDKDIHWCLTISLYCTGKADAADEAPPWETPEPEDTSSGCGCATSDDLGGFGLVGLLLALFATRRGRGTESA